jgi:hypothetical protein
MWALDNSNMGGFKMNDGGFWLGIVFLIFVGLAIMYTKAESNNQQLKDENTKFKLHDFYRNYSLYDLELVEQEMNVHYAELYRKYAVIVRNELPSDNIRRKAKLSIPNEDVENYIISRSKDKQEVAFLVEYLEICSLIENKRRIAGAE